MADMPAACQPAGEFIMAVVAVFSSQQWQLFFSSMTDMAAACQPAAVESIMAFVVVLLAAAVAAVLQQHGRYAGCPPQPAGEFSMAVVAVLSSQQ